MLAYLAFLMITPSLTIIFASDLSSKLPPDINSFISSFTSLDILARHFLLILHSISNFCWIILYEILDFTLVFTYFVSILYFLLIYSFFLISFSRSNEALSLLKSCFLLKKLNFFRPRLYRFRFRFSKADIMFL